MFQFGDLLRPQSHFVGVADENLRLVFLGRMDIRHDGLNRERNVCIVVQAAGDVTVGYIWDGAGYGNWEVVDDGEAS